MNLYHNRKTKARFVYEKYNQVLKGKILDVGADELYLSKHLHPNIKYIGIGLGKNPKLIQVNLEKERIPFKAKSFDCVLCLDVLEHVENIHDVFDELCRVSKKWIIVSLPNPWSDFMYAVRKGNYNRSKTMKYYGLTSNKEEDRHKWFFSPTEANNFITKRANNNGFIVRDLFRIGYTEEVSVLSRMKWEMEKLAFYQKDVKRSDIYSGTHWWLLERNE